MLARLRFPAYSKKLDYLFFIRVNREIVKQSKEQNHCKKGTSKKQHC